MSLKADIQNIIKIQKMGLEKAKVLADKYAKKSDNRENK